MNFTTDIVVYLLGLAATAGTIMARIGALEKKVDKHNSVVERTFKLEERAKSNTHRLDEIEERMKRD